MRIAVLSDIHANLPALAAVLEDAAQQGIDLESKAFWCLGDVIGYGPHPVETLNFLRDYVDPQAWVLGNHEAMLADLVLPQEMEAGKDKSSLMRVNLEEGKGDEVVVRGNLLTYDEWFITTSPPVNAIRLNLATLAEQGEPIQFWQEKFLKEKMGPVELHHDGVDYSLVHASRKKQLSRYIYGWQVDILLPEEFDLLSKHSPERQFPRVQFYGHTHAPLLVRARFDKDGRRFVIFPEKVSPQATITLDTEYALVNPGSVGQPRNLDRRACYAILDTCAHTVTFCRVAYDWQETALDLQKRDYPPSLVARLKTASAIEKETPDDWLEYYREAAKQ